MYLPATTIYFNLPGCRVPFARRIVRDVLLFTRTTWHSGKIAFRIIKFFFSPIGIENRHGELKMTIIKIRELINGYFGSRHGWNLKRTEDGGDRTNRTRENDELTAGCRAARATWRARHAVSGGVGDRTMGGTTLRHRSQAGVHLSRSESEEDWSCILWTLLGTLYYLV